MTKQQARVVEQIKRWVKERDLYSDEEHYEIKKLEVEETEEGTVRFYCITGRKEDEGTLAAVFCRKRRHIFIGKRGGMRCFKWDEKKNKSRTLYGFDVLIFGAES
jgi:hypothetical protein